MIAVELKHVEVEKTGGETYRVPYWDVQSGRPGPRVLVTAAMHGNEVQGCEVIRQFLEGAGRELACGSCLLVPFVNPCAIRNHQPHIDFELSRRPGAGKTNNLNCTWPGQADGNNAQRLSHALFQALVGQATHNLDLHCWNCFWATTALAREDNELALRLAEATAFRFAKRGERPAPVTDRPDAPCLLSWHFNDTGRTAMCVEFAGQYGTWPREIARGVRALHNCFRVLDMLPGEIEGRDEGPIWLNDAEQVKAPAPCAGLFVATHWRTSDFVEEGASLGHVFGTDDLRCAEVRAPASGYLYQYGAAHENTSEHSMMWTHPHVEEGETLAQVIVPG